MFVFAPVVQAWCRQGGLQSADADEVTQEVFDRVRGGIDTFQPGHFVAWIYTITTNVIQEHFRRRGRWPDVVGGSEFAERVAQEPAPKDSDVPASARLIAVRRAMDVVRRDVQEQTWRAFEMVVIEERATAEVAALVMEDAGVRNAKSRVMKRIREELGAFS